MLLIISLSNNCGSLYSFLSDELKDLENSFISIPKEKELEDLVNKLTAKIDPKQQSKIKKFIVDKIKYLYSLFLLTLLTTSGILFRLAWDDLGYNYKLALLEIVLALICINIFSIFYNYSKAKKKINAGKIETKTVIEAILTTLKESLLLHKADSMQQLLNQSEKHKTELQSKDDFVNDIVSVFTNKIDKTIDQLSKLFEESQAYANARIDQLVGTIFLSASDSVKDPEIKKKLETIINESAHVTDTKKPFFKRIDENE